MHVFVFTPSVRVKHFWVDLDEYVGGVYMILILIAWQTSHKGQQSLIKLNTKQVAYMWKFF